MRAFGVPVTMDGLRASIPVRINGKKTTFWLDTGAWWSIMSMAKAQELGLPMTDAPAFFRMYGVGGSFTPHIATAKKFVLNGLVLHRVQFIAGGSDVGTGVIGRNLLSNFDLDLDIGHSSFRIMIPYGDCQHTNMAYWAKDKPVFTVRLLSSPRNVAAIPSLRIPVKLNGREVVAAIDSGATTIISKRAARLAGIDLTAPGVKRTSNLGGFGRHFVKGWKVRLNSVAIGQEVIENAHLTVIDGPITPDNSGPDMLVGIGFLLSHHLFVDRKQNKIFFTYDGGMPFIDEDSNHRLATAPSPDLIPKGMMMLKPTHSASAPKTADGFAKSGAVMLSKNDARGAIKAFSQAISMSPETAAYYRQRAQAELVTHDGKAALADLKKAASLAPGDGDTFFTLAMIYDARGNEQSAYAAGRKAQALLPPQSLKMADIANLYTELGRAAEAVPLYDPVIRAHREGNSMARLLNGLCWASGLANTQIEKAYHDCKRALKLSGNSPVIRDSLALVLYRQKKYSDALDNYNQVLKAQPREAWSLYMRGMTETAMGKAAMGAADRKAALKLQPDLIKRAKAYGLAAPARQSGE